MNVMNGATARIILRYVVGMAVMGSPELGAQLSTDPDIVMFVAGGIGAATELAYVMAKRKGWAT